MNVLCRGYPLLACMFLHHSQSYLREHYTSLGNLLLRTRTETSMSTKGIIFAVSVVVLGYLWLNYVKRGPMYVTDNDLEGKTVLITGGNSGIGMITAIEMARKKARVIIASRNLERSELVKEEIIKQTGNKNIRAIKLDLINFEGIRAFAKEFDESEPFLDILVNNAASFDIPGTTDKGLSKTFTINHFGHFLLTSLLLDKMKAQSSMRPVRIIHVADEAYAWGNITKERIRFSPSTFMEMIYTYMDSKLANVVLTQELNRRLKEYDITSYAIHPGFVYTGPLDKYNVPDWLKISMKWFIGPLFGRDPIYGCQTILYCALDDEVIKYSGGFFSNCANHELWEFAEDKELGKFLWQESEEVTGLVNL